MKLKELLKKVEGADPESDVHMSVTISPIGSPTCVCGAPRLGPPDAPLQKTGGLGSVLVLGPYRSRGPIVSLYQERADES